MPHQVALVMALALVAILVLVALDRLALWMERRGWIYWRKRPRSEGGGGMSGLLTDFQQLVEPEVRHVIEAREQERALKIDLAGQDDGDQAKCREIRRGHSPRDKLVVMQVELTREDLARFISQQVDTGRYASPQAAVEAAVEHLMFESQTESLTEEDLCALDEAQASIDRGEYVELSAFAAAMRKKYCGR